MKIFLRLSVAVCFGLVMAAGLASSADKEETPKPSSYAPARHLASQVELYVEQASEDLEEERRYRVDEQQRVEKAANTIIVLAQVLGNHDEEHPLKSAAPALIAAATKLSAAGKDYAAAKSALEQLQQAMQSSDGGEVSWEPVADLPTLMKQVPIVNNRLRSGVNGSRFKRTLDQNAGHAATLAAIAQVSSFDKDYCSGEEDEQQWAAICASMRDAAAEVQTALANEDQEAAKAGLAKLVDSCDRCHEVFR